jgi:transcriptional regulator with XRE-family HTH domain
MRRLMPINPLDTLQRRCDGRPLNEAAADLGVSSQYLSDVLHGRREPGPKILNALGLERVVTYRKKKA